MSQPTRRFFGPRSVLAAAVAAVLPAAAVSASDAPLYLLQDAERQVEEDRFGENLSFAGAVTFTNAYFFRGYLQENRGVIMQPEAELGILLFEDADERFALSLNVGLWNSLHTRRDTADPFSASPSNWYESDFYTALGISSGPLSFSVVYTIYAYPSGAAGTIQEIGAQVGYGLVLSPEDAEVQFNLGFGAGVFYETNNANGSELAYGEVGVTPSVDFVAFRNTPLTLALPVTVGFSLDDYYVDATGSDDTFGFLSVALEATIPLAFIPDRYGAWSFTLAGEWLYLNADVLSDLNDGDNEFIARAAVGLSF